MGGGDFGALVLTLGPRPAFRYTNPIKSFLLGTNLHSRRGIKGLVLSFSGQRFSGNQLTYKLRFHTTPVEAYVTILFEGVKVLQS